MSLGPGDPIEIEALRTDRYLESLLAGRDSGPDPVSGPDAAIRRAAARLERDLVRVHPSFRFEERLATRLADLAISLRLPAAAGAGGDAVAPVVLPAAADPAFDAGLPDPLGLPAAHLSPGLVRPVLIGGAITSAALSIAAYLAWRRTRLPQSPMVRAVRAARLARHGLFHPPPPPWRRAD